MENGNQPITPQKLYKQGDVYVPLGESDSVYNQVRTIGLTKREYFAGKALQGLLLGFPARNERDVKYIANLAIKASDALLLELSKQTEQ